MHHADDAAWDIAITSHAVQTLRCVAAGLAFVWHHLGRTTLWAPQLPRFLCCCPGADVAPLLLMLLPSC